MKKIGLLVGTLLLASQAWATSIVLPTEDDMIQHADAIFTGTVASMMSYDATESPYIRTEVVIDVDESMKGVDERLVALQEPGGTTNWTLHINGAPEYQVGDDVLVLAKKLPDGTLQTLLMEAGRIPLKATLFGLGAFAVAPSVVEAKDSVSRWKEEVAKKALALPRIDAKDSSLVVAPSNFVGAPAEPRFMGAKWHKSTVPAEGPAEPDAVMGSFASLRAINNAASAWNSTESALQLKSTWELGSAAGFQCDAGEFAISFNDPLNEIQDPFNCSGVLAIGGFYADGQSGADGFQGISCSALVFNNGWNGCNFWSADRPANFEEVMTHEVGHGVGLAHSCERSQECDEEGRAAIMYWQARFTGSGALLTGYDVKAIRTLYPAPSPSITPPTSTPIPTTTVPTPDATPTNGAPEPTPKGCKSTGAADALLVMGVVMIVGGRRWVNRSWRFIRKLNNHQS